MIRTYLSCMSWKRVFVVLFLNTVAVSIVSHAQSLGYEGPTGIFVTPIASVAPSESNGFGHPVVAYHFLNGGSVIGNYSTISITDGAFKRIEFGYTGEIHSGGSDHTNAVDLSPLWTGNMSIVHGKVNLIPENAWKTKWMPAISIGAIGRFSDNNVGDGSNSAALHSALSISNVGRRRLIPMSTWLARR